MFNGGQPNFVSSDILADSQRYNMDTKANTYGKLLLELCKNKSIKAYDHVAEYKAYHKYIWNVSRIDQYKLSLRNNECIKI